MQVDEMYFQRIIHEKAVVRLIDDHQTHSIVHAGPSCYIDKNNILVKGEFQKPKIVNRNCIITLTNTITGNIIGKNKFQKYNLRCFN